jgi:transposase
MGWTPPDQTASSVPEWKVFDQLQRMTEASTMNITVMGIDLAKNVLQVHGVDQQGKAVLRRQLRRNQVMVFFCSANTMPGGDGSLWRRQ